MTGLSLTCQYILPSNVCVFIALLSVLADDIGFRNQVAETPNCPWKLNLLRDFVTANSLVFSRHAMSAGEGCPYKSNWNSQASHGKQSHSKSETNKSKIPWMEEISHTAGQPTRLNR